MNNKVIDIVIGATGGIGEGFVRHLAEENRNPVSCPVRRLEDAQKMFEGLPVIPMYCQDLSQQEHVDAYIKSLAGQGYIPNRIFLAAGSFKWDNDSRVENYPSPAEIADMLYRANCLTKKTVIDALKKYYPDTTRLMTVVIVGSQAANFAETDERRINRATGFKEEGYIASMQKVAELYHQLEREGDFGRVILEEPGIIDTPMARTEFVPETIGTQINWFNEVSPENYTRLVLVKHKLTMVKKAA
jgi:NAD(P)-dependent dehydrogenase (short-subunit alcohol dehydrogenase family)